MKNILTIICLISIFTTAKAQEGIIDYTTKMNNHRRLTGEREAMKNMIPEFTTFKYQLYFNATESLYKPSEEEEDEVVAAGGGVRMRMPQSETYFNHAASRKVIQRDVMGKSYLIIDSLKITPWKFNRETKTILGYICKQAYYYNETNKQEVIAWYTEKLRPFLGPEGFHTLPGAVLGVDINDGERTIVATKVNLKALKKKDLVEPTKGEKVTEKEFQAMMEEQMKKMGGSGNRMFIRN
jgi:GLPGLI family protein